MDGSRSGGGVTQPDGTGELGMRRSHECRHLFVPHRNVLQVLLGALERDIQTADTVTRIAVDASNAPFLHAMPYKIAHIHRHGYSGVLARADKASTVHL